MLPSIKMRLLFHAALVRALHNSAVQQRVLKRRDLAVITAAALGTRALPAVAAPPACDDAVALWSNGNRQVYIVGTAHVSEKSADLVAQTIDAVQPTLVMLELDRKRMKGAPAAAAPPIIAAALLPLPCFFLPADALPTTPCQKYA